MTRQGYITDISQSEWPLMAPFFNRVTKAGRPTKYPSLNICNALSFILATGTQWRNMPNDFPPWESVYYYFRKWTKDGSIKMLEEFLIKKLRLANNKSEWPTAGVIDAQSVDCPTSGEERGFDVSKNVKGRKRHILTDVLGIVLVLVVTTANITDRQGAVEIMSSKDFPKTIKHIWVDKGYRGPIVASAAAKHGVNIEVVANPSPHEFAVAAHRWVVERTNAWVSAARRLTVDREKTVASSSSMIRLRLCLLYATRIAENNF